MIEGVVPVTKSRHNRVRCRGRNGSDYAVPHTAKEPQNQRGSGALQGPSSAAVRGVETASDTGRKISILRRDPRSG